MKKALLKFALWFFKDYEKADYICFGICIAFLAYIAGHLINYYING